MINYDKISKLLQGNYNMKLNNIIYQRGLDIIFSLLAIIIFLPILITLSIILSIISKDRIIYKQKRVGINGNLFDIYKFTTMLENSEKIGTGIITLKNDSRVFPFGKFLRKTKFNELPQLFNILKGDMSIIGPRPMPEEHFIRYSSIAQKNLKQIKPGLSGLGSIIFRNEDEILSKVKNNKINFYNSYISPYKGEIEIWYVKNRNLSLYFILICLTIKVVLFPKYKIDYQKKFQNIPVPPRELEVALI